MTLIGVHEMRDRVHPNQCHVTGLLVVYLCSWLSNFMVTHPLPVASKLPIVGVCVCVCVRTCAWHVASISILLHRDRPVMLTISTSLVLRMRRSTWAASAVGMVDGHA